MAKPRKPLTDVDKWKNLCDSLAEDTAKDTTPLTEVERVKAQEVKDRLLRRVAQEREAERSEKNTGRSR